MTCLKDFLYYRDEQVTLLLGDALAVASEMADGSVDCIVTSPPYFGLRDYGVDGQYGLESSPAEYVETMRTLFAELRRVLADDGTLWLNVGDSYARNPAKGTTGTMNGRNVPRMGYAGDRIGKPDIAQKNLLGIPWRVAFALQDDGWILRNDIVWHKPNAMPESVSDRLSNRHEHVFMFSKSRTYWFDLDPVREPIEHPGRVGYRSPVIEADQTPYAPGVRPQAGRARTGKQRKYIGSELGRNPGDVWPIPTNPFSDAHFAVFPVALPQRCIAAGCKPDGTVLDPFSGSGTTGLAAQRLGRKYVGIDINAEYLDLSLRTRLHDAALDFNEVTQ